MRQRIRTLKEAVDLTDGSTVTAKMLLANGDDFCDKLRRKATANRFTSTPIVCDRCGWPIYVSKNGFTREYFFAHFKGTHSECPWFTGKTLTVDQASALQFQGAQESPLHHFAKNEIGHLLRDFDERATDVVVDEYLIAEHGRRKPDVRATYAGRPIAIEIQLSSTQLPIILKREEFYTTGQRGLIWVTWNLQPTVKSFLPQSFRDIALSHNGNLFSVDTETIARSRKLGEFTLRATWWIENLPHQELITLSQLTWPENELPYFIEPPLAWHLAFQKEWIETTLASTLKWDVRRELWQKIIDWRSLSFTPNEIDLEYEALEPLISLLMSLSRNRPIGSKENNLTQMLNTFLSTKARRPFAKLVVFFARRVGLESLFERESTRAKLKIALEEPQKGWSSFEAEIVVSIFPEFLKVK